MAPRKSVSKSKIVAKIVTDKKLPCDFCQREVDDELTYGKLYAIGNIQCHYFCVLLSSCLVQKGRDEDGLFGFIYEDILSEIERAKKHKCSYCSRGGANLGCSVSQCRKQFHLPCGRERNAVSLFYGNYKSFCQSHAPKQNIPAVIMVKAQQRRISDNKAKKKDPNFRDLKELSICGGDDASGTDTQSVCVICYEAVDGYPTVNTFWPPCCARDAWFHRNCLQRMALSAGMHYLKCPLCNDKDNFYQAVVTQGYYVPDRDAAWELEQNAFSEIYDREVSCSAADCECPMGRSHDADQGSWCIKLCLLCGSSGAHNACLAGSPGVHVCATCTPAAPEHIEQLASSIEAVITQEQQQSTSRTRRGPVMPSRMSLRRTKRHTNSQNLPSCSSSGSSAVKTEVKSEPPSNTSSSRQDLNLKTPKKLQQTSSKTNILENIKKSKSTPTKRDFKSASKVSDDFQNLSPGKGLELKYISPSKMLEESLRNRMGSNNVTLDENLVEDLRKKFRKPKPLSEKRKIVNDILNGVFDSLLQEPKQKEAVRQWCSPKKCDAIEIIEILDDSPPSNSNKGNSKTPTKQETKAEYTTTPKRSPTDLRIKFKTEPENIFPIFNSPKNLKTVDILKDSSLEISAKDEIINIDMIKIENSQNNEFLKKLELKSPEKTKKCAFKFSPYNKEVLESENIDIDLESFKDQYLNEVGLQRVVKKDVIPTEDEKLIKDKTAKKSRKRKLEDDKIVLKYESKKRRKDKKKNRKNISINNKNIQVKIKWRKEQLKLKIESKNKKKKSKKFKQYILECSSENCSTIKPNNDFTPIKKKKLKKNEKTPDNLIQTSIQKFFKIKSPSSD
ncbi:hypothetical protein PYW07_012649 [Mythimna separata]|uniref:G2/M phase-specific E3 ubiquitin-protein ligase n=1 Tax=Mythimna separata TaxID=271217 RepID=A0AAD7Y8T6_MYTSE|nr:hypothetical protein PYW07_012649 [Mythimna separata]